VIVRKDNAVSFYAEDCIDDFADVYVHLVDAPAYVLVDNYVPAIIKAQGDEMFNGVQTHYTAK